MFPRLLSSDLSNFEIDNESLFIYFFVGAGLKFVSCYCIFLAVVKIL